MRPNLVIVGLVVCIMAGCVAAAVRGPNKNDYSAKLCHNDDDCQYNEHCGCGDDDCHEKLFKCKKGFAFKKCLSNTTYIFCDGQSCEKPRKFKCSNNTFCACDGFCNSTLFANPCQEISVPPLGSSCTGQIIDQCYAGLAFAKCINSSTYLLCDGVSCSEPVNITCQTGTVCGCNGFCNSTQYSNPCVPSALGAGGVATIPSWPTGPYTSVFLGNITSYIGATLITTLIPGGQLWANGLGAYHTRWHETVNGAAVEKFITLYPASPLSCEYSGDTIPYPHKCSLSMGGTANDFLLGLILPSTTVLVSTIISPSGDTLEVYQNTQGCPFNPPTSVLCLQETWVYDATTGHFTSYTRSETGVGYTSVEKIDFLWVVETPVNANLFIKPAFCNSNCP